MSSCHDALLLAEMGFHVFRCAPNTKVPIKNSHWQTEATNDPEKIKQMWGDGDFNIGISTDHFKSDMSLIVIDVDCKEKDGFASAKKLESEGKKFPKTMYQQTPSGGMHLIYWYEKPLKQGTSVLGEGIDIRSRGGYIIGATSILPNGIYAMKDQALGVQHVPPWIAEHLEAREIKPKKTKLSVVKDVNQETAKTQATEYLKSIPIVSSGERNHEGFKVACKLKDFGCMPDDIYFLLQEYWKCEPALDGDEIVSLVNSAFAYGKNDPGVSSPEAIFGKPEDSEGEKQHPILELNKEYFYVVSGGQSRIYREHKDENGRFKLESLRVPTFHDLLRPKTIITGGRTRQLSEEWFDSPNRREYKGIIFRPDNKPTPGYYNLWRGFAVEPKTRAETPEAGRIAFDLFLEHTTQNICDGDFELSHWLIGYFAHLMQKPMEKPGVAIVLKGMKGTGKNVFIETIGSLLGNHSVVVSDRRYLVGNFNSILENKLLFTLDEAFWSGDKGAEGILKALVTGKNKVIEKKGLEPEEACSLERVVIIGNEEWLVPATAEERRFAVFNIGHKRRNDRKFFGAINDGMENHGGLSLLLRYLLDYDISQLEVRKAPETRGLMEQKESSLDIVQAWWLQSLREGRVLGYLNNQNSWPIEVSTQDLLRSITNHLNDEGMKGWRPNGVTLGKKFKTIASGCSETYFVKAEGHSSRMYKFQTLEKAREEWDKYMNHKTDWA